MPHIKREYLRTLQIIWYISRGNQFSKPLNNCCFPNARFTQDDWVIFDALFLCREVKNVDSK